MSKDWHALTALTRGARIEIERVRLIDEDIAIEGRFELPPLARLTNEDQVFVAAFVRCHGSIKQMEKYFGVSYPTIKNRLNRIGGDLAFVQIDPTAETPTPSARDLLKQLENGELTVNEVLARLKGDHQEDGHDE